MHAMQGVALNYIKFVNGSLSKSVFGMGLRLSEL